MARNLAQKLIGDRLVARGPTPGAEVGIRIDQIADRARATGDHFVVGGWNYGQSSSREHAAIVPRYLGLRAVLAAASPESIVRTS
jgi:aconitase A